jgi:hypothetical protein
MYRVLLIFFLLSLATGCTGLLQRSSCGTRLSKAQSIYDAAEKKYRESENDAAKLGENINMTVISALIDFSEAARQLRIIEDGCGIAP